MSDPEQKRREVRQRLIDENEFPHVPDDWSVERLRFLFTESKERNGKSPVGEMLSVSEYRGVVPREYEHEEQKRADEELENYRVVRRGQLAVNSMWLNHLGLGVSEHTGHVSPAYNVYDISDRLDRRFVHHLMRSNYYLKIYLRYLYGIRPNSFQIKSNDWASIPIIVPDLATQRQIADFLDRETARIDLLIEKKQRLVALLGEKETGLIDSLFFHVGSTETTTWKRYRVPRTRDGFELKKLSYVCSLLRDGTHQPPARVDEGYPLLSVRNIVDGKFVLRGDDSKISEDDFRALCKSFEVKQGDVLLAVVGATLGKSAVVEEMPAVQIQRSLAIMRPLPDAIDGRYLLLFLKSGFFQELLWSSTSFSAQPGVYLSSLGSFPIAVPKISRQREIVWDFERMATSLGEIKSKTNTSIERLKEYRSALITAAVTGQIDVQTYARSGTTDRRLDAIQEEMSA